MIVQVDVRHLEDSTPDRVGNGLRRASQATRGWNMDNVHVEHRTEPISADFDGTTLVVGFEDGAVSTLTIRDFLHHLALVVFD